MKIFFCTFLYDFLHELCSVSTICYIGFNEHFGFMKLNINMNDYITLKTKIKEKQLNKVKTDQTLER